MIIPREQHNLSRQHISANALKVLYRLKKAGYAGYLVGGGVRDLLLGRVPKDFDVATDGHPEELRALFRNSRIIGRRFRLLHVFFQEEVIELSTFRANVSDDTATDDNVYGTIEEDAWRRDFTVNALYYNINDFSVIDYTGGIADLQRQQIRMIGDPQQRYHEDPVRLLRAIRLAAKLDFTIEQQTEAPLTTSSSLLQHVPKSRLFDELLKLFFGGNAVASFRCLRQYRYHEVLLPTLRGLFSQANADQLTHFIDLALQETDVRFHDGRSLNPGFLLAVLLWPAIVQTIEQQQCRFSHFYQALHHAIDATISHQNEAVYIPRRLATMMRTIWLMQYQLLNRRGKRVYRTLGHRYFRAALDFLSLRVRSSEPYQHELDWWHAFQKATPVARDDMVSALVKAKRKRR